MGVILAETPQFSVRAAAGSGKTSVLVERYFHHIETDGLSPDQILAVTFTRRAAAMMKERIVDRLRSAGKIREAELAETGPIYTIHSFCERLLRENALMAGIDAGFVIADDGLGKTMVDRAVRRALATAPSEGPEAASLLVARSNTVEGTSDVSLRNVIEKTMDQLRSGGRSRAELGEIYRSVETLKVFWRDICLEELPLDVRQIIYSEPSYWPEGAVQLVRSSGYKPPLWLRTQRGQTEDEEASATVGLMRFVLAAWAHLDEQMTAEQTFDFTRLEAEAVSLIERSDSVREKLARQYRAALIDEAQDVNPVQYRLLDSVATGRSMMVGDPQQSIYRFRFADPELFVRRATELPCHDLDQNYRSRPGILRFVDLLFGREWGEDYRPMAPATPATVEDPFAHGTFEGVEVWPAENGKDSLGMVARMVDDLVEENGGEKGIAVLCLTNRYLSNLADMLVRRKIACRKVGGSDKFFAKMEIRDLANALDALSDPTRDFALLALLHSPFVGISYDALVLLAERREVFEALEDFKPKRADDAAKLDAFRRWFLPLSARAALVPAWELLGPMLDQTPYLEVVSRPPRGMQTLANVRKLLSMAAADTEAGAHEFAERIRQVQRLGHHEGNAPAIDVEAPAVVLTTVHRAKGLEWPIVVVADTFAPFRPRPNRSLVVCNGQLGAVATRFRTETPAYSCLLHRAVIEEVAETRRKMYVAMTRAKERLCCLIANEGGDETPAALIASAAGFPRRVLPGIHVRREGD
ncbi:MAG: UvrD-helicase domain-containing protein [Fimbriimonadaceae bacterium]|nr:UvrD-helicase domain-containing protein [Fimbriimonadaceae bacterium]QYK56695.1 MAG: UvrD-helicase domain-containing protein [Fimbriimonadaceae bacterium]